MCVGTRFYIRSSLLRELITSQLVAVATHSDTGSHNRLDLIQSLVPPHYVCNVCVFLEKLRAPVIKSMHQHTMHVIRLSNISIKINFKQITMVELKCVQYSQGDYILCMTSRYFVRSSD
jgi:hypothetical protein